MKKYLLIVFCLLMTVVSCKKSDSSEPIDEWVGKYTGEVTVNGIIHGANGMLDDTIFSKTFTEKTMTVTRITSTKALVTVWAVPFNTTIDGTTASFEGRDYPFIYSYPIGQVTVNLTSITFNGFNATYNNGVINGTCDATGNGNAAMGILSSDLTFEMKLNLNNFTKITE